MRAQLPAVAERDGRAPSSTRCPATPDAFSGPMGETIRNAVQLALGGFLSLASGRRGADPRTPAAPAVEGAYQLGRGEARSGRSMDALLAAYRIGARVSWREMSTTAVRNGLDAETLAGFAELVFAYIDELSAASVAGHTDELDTTGRVRQRLLERLAHHLLSRRVARDRGHAPPSAPTGRRRDADRGDRARGAGPAGARPLSAGTLQAAGPARASTRARCCWCPTPTAAAGRRCCARCGPGRDRRPGPAVAGRCARRTTGRCGRAPSALEADTEAQLPSWC